MFLGMVALGAYIWPWAEASLKRMGGERKERGTLSYFVHGPPEFLVKPHCSMKCSLASMLKI